MFALLFAHDAQSTTQTVGAGFHGTSYWQELVEFSQEPGRPETAIAVLISDLHDSTRLVQTRGRQSAVGTAVIISSCHALTNRHLAFEQPNLSRAELRNTALSTKLVLVAGRGPDGRPLVKRARPIQFGDPGGAGLSNIGRDWALLELDDCFKPGEVQPAALLAATAATYEALSGKLQCAAFPIEDMSFDAVARGEHKLVGTTGASIIGELDVGGYLHNCGSKPGFSGMPIYTISEGRMLVIALNVGTVRNQPDYSRPMEVWDAEYANTAVPVSALIRAIDALVPERLKLKRIQGAP
ncbi:MAG: hypothetical protein ACXWCY_16905 [Burkholderiales bacterium]